MSKYYFESSLWISVTKEQAISLDPRNYLYCEDEDELYDMICLDISDKIEFPDLDNIKDSDLIWNYPEGFLEEWRGLKKKENE